MNRWPSAVAISMLISAWGSLQLVSGGESIPTKKPFAEFPLAIPDAWRGKELGLEPDVLKVLQLSDYMMRVYVPERDGTSPPVWLYVGYYQSQRTGTTYHSPKNCLPGSGWQFVADDVVTLPVSDKTAITINKALIKKGLDQQIILYWYHDRGRVVASEYWAKGYMVWDAMTKHRTDGALVRLSVPVTTTAEDAYAQGLKFLQDVWPLLQDHMPAGHDLS